MDINNIMEEVQAIKVLPHMMFNASKLKVLSDYVNVAFENNEYYDNDVMLTLLRLFCLYPHCYDKDIIKKILICVLYNINNVDMNMYMSLINSSLYDDNIKSVIYIYELIKNCQYKKLWNCINNNIGNEDNNCDYSYLKNDKNFICNIRKYILNTISISFESIYLKNMSEYLNIQDNTQLEQFLNENKWTIKMINHKGKDEQICYNGNIETVQNKKNINTYFTEDNIGSYITKLNH